MSATSVSNIDKTNQTNKLQRRSENMASTTPVMIELNKQQQQQEKQADDREVKEKASSDTKEEREKREKMMASLAALSAARKQQLGENVVICNAVSKSFKLADRSEEVHALRGIDLTKDSPFPAIKKGEFIMIRGPSGGGKTTLLNILGTIDHPTEGTVEILGDTVNKDSPDAFLADLRLKKIGFVFQTFNLIATMSAFENVELPMTILGKYSPKECEERAIKLLTMVGLQDRLEHLPSELSGGEQQRVTIARALANEPQILLLDEPTGDLDTRNTIDVMDLLLEINHKNKTTCIMVTHNPDLECYADRILYVQDGKFKRQITNKIQSKLQFETYMQYVKNNET